ncbi:unnamed protein product [Effrenium voratum]|uniref:Kinesin-like protein n=1 Tax=Effrenium voratum TaxID=2562239 RepID=A0AA36NDA1_9DINO|nr:unnamed protein product [Effrenium voratum]
MASRISCLVLTLAALLAAVCTFSSILPKSEAFVSQAPQLRSRNTALQGERMPGRDRQPTDLDEQYGKPPPTETPQFATSNLIFNIASVLALLVLGFFIVDIGAVKMEYASYGVYKEKMKDLLRPNVETLRVKELPQRGLFVDGLSREYVTCPADVMSVIRAGLRTRVVGKTRCNLHSSRSHAIFVLHAEQRSLQGEERLGKLTLVDLAGSEKVSKSESVGETLEEAKKINWSLSALGKVIDALVEQRSHVPYRDSQLTRVLQEALGGNCRTTLLVAASGCAQHADETLSSLRFATRAKNVRNVAKVNYTFSQEQLLLVVAKLQKQLMSGALGS